MSDGPVAMVRTETVGRIEAKPVRVESLTEAGCLRSVALALNETNRLLAIIANRLGGTVVKRRWGWPWVPFAFGTVICLHEILFVPVARPSILVMGSALLGWPLVAHADAAAPVVSGVTRWCDRKGRWVARIEYAGGETTVRGFRWPERREAWVDRVTGVREPVPPTAYRAEP